MLGQGIRTMISRQGDNDTDSVSLGIVHKVAQLWPPRVALCVFAHAQEVRCSEKGEYESEEYCLIVQVKAHGHPT